MNTNYAYAQGALTKLAEHNISPQQFVDAAVRTQDPVALKVANALMHMPGQGFTQEAVSMARRLNPLEKMRNMAGANKELLQGAAGGALGAGALGGAAYGMGDANTLGNQAANLSNQYLGTDLDTQSRFGNMMG